MIQGNDVALQSPGPLSEESLPLTAGVTVGNDYRSDGDIYVGLVGDVNHRLLPGKSATFYDVTSTDDVHVRSASDKNQLYHWIGE
jgi:hypothetical protein